MISLFIKAALSNTSPTIHGDGRQTRDFTYVDNVVDGVLRAVTAASAAGEVINVASGGRVSLLEMWEELQRQTGATAQPEFGPAREGDVKDSQADIAKAARLLGYKPVVGFSEGLKRTLEWSRGS